jgi:hypothetical protein
MNFDSPPEDLDYSVALEPMRLEVIGEQRAALSELLNELVATHPAKVKVKERDHLRSTYRLILLNVIHNSICRVYTALPRAAGHFSKGSYWQRCGLSYRVTVRVLDRLHDDGLIQMFKGFYTGWPGTSRLTRVFGTDALASRVNAQQIADSVEFEWQDDAQLVVLKDSPYGADSLNFDHPDVVKLREINAFLKDHHWQQRGPVRIIYNSTPLTGGRVYTRCQNLPSKFRLAMKIDGRCVVELDYKSNHLAMLIAMTGQTMPKDPYQVVADAAQITRSKVKEFVTVSLGASSQRAARQALGRKRMTRGDFDRIWHALTESFPGVPLFNGLGTMLQSLEGQIALDIMVNGARSGIVVIPVHDSFITTADNEHWLRHEMHEQWLIHTGAELTTRVNIEKKK